jgi:hypothetical protein
MELKNLWNIDTVFGLVLRIPVLEVAKELYALTHFLPLLFLNVIVQ